MAENIDTVSTVPKITLSTVAIVSCAANLTSLVSLELSPQNDEGSEGRCQYVIIVLKSTGMSLSSDGYHLGRRRSIVRYFTVYAALG